MLVVGGASESLREGPEPEGKVGAGCVPLGGLQAQEGGGSVPRSTESGCAGPGLPQERAQACAQGGLGSQGLNKGSA